MIKRYSPVSFKSKPAQTVMRDGWEVVLAYEDEGVGPFVIDLSHISKWDIQAADLSQIQPQAVNIPGDPGACVLGKMIAKELHRMIGRGVGIVKIFWNIYPCIIACKSFRFIMAAPAR